MFYEQLKQACKDNNTSVTAVLKKIGVGAANGTYWKNGSSPSADIVIQLSELLHVSTDFLLKGKKDISSTIDLSMNEQEMLDVFSKFNDREQIKLIGRLEELYRQKQIQEDQQSVQKAYIAARSYDNHAPETVVGDFSEIFNAPDATDKYK